MEEAKKLALTVEEVANILGIGLSTAYDAISAGVFRARQINRKWIIPRSALDEFLEGRDNPAKTMTIEEVSTALGVHRTTTSSLINSGSIRARRLGKTYKIPLSALEEFLSGRDNACQPKQGGVMCVEHRELMDVFNRECIEQASEMVCEFFFRLSGIAAEIRVKVYRERDGSLPYRFETSHYIKTPEQAGRYVTSRPYGDNIQYALRLGVTSLTQYYESAVRNGHQPQDSWLEENSSFPK